MRALRLSYRFVEYIPEQLEDGVLYVSLPYTTVIHLCACGCGSTIVTPLSPTDWSLTFDGTAVSLSPSIGNWSYPCRSHYWIRNDTVSWARRARPGEIAALRAGTNRPDPEKTEALALVIRLWRRLRRTRRRITETGLSRRTDRT